MCTLSPLAEGDGGVDSGLSSQKVWSVEGCKQTFYSSLADLRLLKFYRRYAGVGQGLCSSLHPPLLIAHCIISLPF